MSRITYAHIIAIAIGIVCACGVKCAAKAKMGPVASPDKKVIIWCVDGLDDVYVSEHVNELEQRPIDGMAISVFPDSWSKDPLDRQHRNYNLGGSAKFSFEDFKGPIERLKKCKFTRLTDNFLDFSTSCRGASLADWFSEDWDDVVLNNLVVTAKVARAVGFKGIFVDTESYYTHLPEFRERRGDPWKMPFEYSNYVKECEKDGVAPRGFEECRAKLRQRGREVGKAITQAYPDIVLFFMAGIGDAVGYQELRIPFVDGILETAGPNVKVYDGGEDMYPRMLYSSHMRYRKTAQANGMAASYVPKLFKERVKYGIAIWVDAYLDFYGGFHTDDLTKNHKDGVGFEHTLYNALTASDKYAWIYVWHPRTWWVPNHALGTETGHCALCPHKEVPKPYRDAMLNCRKPHDLNWTPVKKDDNVYQPASKWAGHEDDSIFAKMEQDYELAVDLSKEKWAFYLDAETPMSGLHEPDSLYAPINIGEFYQNQGFRYGNGIAWYRCWFNVPETVNGRSLEGREFVLVYGGVSGTTYAWITRKQVDANDTLKPYTIGGSGPTQMYPGGEPGWLYAELARHYDDDAHTKMAEGWSQDMTFFIKPGVRHRISLRVWSPRGPGGIWKPIRLYVRK